MGSRSGASNKTTKQLRVMVTSVRSTGMQSIVRLVPRPSRERCTSMMLRDHGVRSTGQGHVFELDDFGNRDASQARALWACMFVFGIRLTPLIAVSHLPRYLQ